MTPTNIDNLFTSLHKWAHRQDENFTTTALVFFLQHLLKVEQDRPVAIRILQFIAAHAVGCPGLTPAAENVRVVMHQPKKDESEPDEKGTRKSYVYPDIQIEYNIDYKCCLIYLEGKLKSKLYEKQRQRYLALKNRLHLFPR